MQRKNNFSKFSFLNKSYAQRFNVDFNPNSQRVKILYYYLLFREKQNWVLKRKEKFNLKSFNTLKIEYEIESAREYPLPSNKIVNFVSTQILHNSYKFTPFNIRFPFFFYRRMKHSLSETNARKKFIYLKIILDKYHVNDNDYYKVEEEFVRWAMPPIGLKKKVLKKINKQCAELKLKAARKRKFFLKARRIKYFFIYFKQQHWVATLFSSFIKNGKKKIGINFYLNIIIYLKKKYKKNSTYFVSLYFNQVMVNALPLIGFRFVNKRGERYRYPLLAGSIKSRKYFNQLKALSIRWIKISVFRAKRSELTVFLKLWSALQELRANYGIAVENKRKFYYIFYKKKTYEKLHRLAKWI